MPKRCPPGVICFEKVTITILVVIFLGILLWGFYPVNKSLLNKEHEEHEERRPIPPLSMFNLSSLFARPNYSFSTIPNDVLMNPYEPPLRDDRYFNSPTTSGIVPFPPTTSGIVPINIPTQSVDTAYRQVGLLTRINGGETILPLMGRPLFSNRDKWNFYTMSDKNNMIKLPVTNKGKSCTNEYGCDNLYNGDTVYVEGYNDAFKATIYDNQVMRYLPFF